MRQSIFLIVFLISSRTYCQELGVLKTKKQLLTYAINNGIKYNFSINDRNLTVLTLEQREYDCRYTFNSRSICFNAFIEFNSKTHVPIFEKYLTANYKLTHDPTSNVWYWLLETKERRISIRKSDQFGLPYYNCFVIFYKQ